SCVWLALDSIYILVELATITSVRRPPRLNSPDCPLEYQSCRMRLMNRLRLPVAVFVNSDFAVKNRSRDLEEDPAPKLLLVNRRKVLLDPYSSPGKETLVTHLFHVLNKLTLFRPDAALGNLDTEVNKPCKLHVVEVNKRVFE